MPQQQPEPQHQRCRHIRAGGYPCSNRALIGHESCYLHYRDQQDAGRFHTPLPIDIQHLDSHAAIQAASTSIARALLAGTLDPTVARVLNATIANAIRTLPRPVAAHKSGQKSGQETAAATPETVAEIVLTPEGLELTPAAPYHGPDGPKERRFDFSEFLYHKIFPGNEDQPLPEEGYREPRNWDAVLAARNPPAGNQPEQQYESPKPTPEMLKEIEQMEAEEREGRELMEREEREAKERTLKAAHQPEPGIIPQIGAAAAESSATNRQEYLQKSCLRSRQTHQAEPPRQRQNRKLENRSRAHPAGNHFQPLMSS